MFPEIKPFKFWVQKVLPLVYDDSLSYYEVLAKVVKKLDEVISTTNTIGEAVERLDGELVALAAAQSEQYTELSSAISDEVTRALGAEYDIRADLSALSDYVTAQLALKQDKLTAGQQITFDGATINAENRGHVVFYGDSVVEATYGGNPVLMINHEFTSGSPYNQGVPIEVGDIVITNVDKTLYGTTYKKGSIFHVTANAGAANYGIVEYIAMVVDVEAGGGGVWGEITGTLADQTDLQTALDGKLSLSGGAMIGDLTFSAARQIKVLSGLALFVTFPNNDSAGLLIGDNNHLSDMILQVNSNKNVFVRRGSSGANIILDAGNTSANPTLSGGETALTSLKLNGINYAVGGSTVWGGITGSIANQTDLQTALDGKLSLSGGTMTGAIERANGAVITNSGDAVMALNAGNVGIGLYRVYSGLTLRSGASDIVHNRVDGISVNVLDGHNTTANATIAGTESNLTSLKLNGTTYKVLPAVTGADAGKFLRVDAGGDIVAETVPNANTASF